MYSKIAVFSAFVAICSAGVILDDGHGHSHGHAVSSQSIVRHDEPSHHVESHYDGHNDGHGQYAPVTTVYQHSAPLQHSGASLIEQSSHVQHSYEHSAPVYHSAPVHHVAPVVHHAAPIQHTVQYSAPQVHYSAPQEHYSAPQVHYSAPQIQHAAPQIHHAPIVQHVAPVAVAVGHGHQEHIEEHVAPAKYEYAYSVEDPHTGDHKSQHETRDGDVVKGEYSLLQPDGSIRKVTYTADHHNGFNAIVHNSAPSVHAEPAHAHHDGHALNEYHH